MCFSEATWLRYWATLVISSWINSSEGVMGSEEGKMLDVCLLDWTQNSVLYKIK